ncbi:hypothetical protein H6P81_005278 [Aristolochia fimbriata]|uniref:Bifunctional inhibitor/plant lipid transfer protein/seed storage helical domain-containing protein n=1 Tax=Aristolochia fimbriata TaxID=158543 RepID=A0AAV7EV60_ARIFI|nr:hypothetical protein H6P81_005278 [Aristolochia fimbriata]
MASKRSASLTLFLALNLLFFVLVSANDNCGCHPSPKPKPKPKPKPSPPPSAGKCPRDALKLGVCANLLGLVNVIVGSPPTLPCCSLLKGLADLEAALCLCTAIKANILGLNLNIPVSLSLLLNDCGRKMPSGFDNQLSIPHFATPPSVRRMASTSSTASAAALFLTLNLLFFSLVTAHEDSPVSSSLCGGGCGGKPNPNPNPPPTPSGSKCPRDALKLGVCANVLGLVKAKVGSPPTLPCCSLLDGLIDLEAAVCLCTAIKANVLGINIDIPISLSLLLNVCGKNPPTGFQCY